jgi:hypothetical protein
MARQPRPASLTADDALDILKSLSARERRRFFEQLCTLSQENPAPRWLTDYILYRRADLAALRESLELQSASLKSLMRAVADLQPLVEQQVHATEGYKKGPQRKKELGERRRDIIRRDIEMKMENPAILMHLRQDHDDLVRKGKGKKGQVKDATLLKEIHAIRSQVEQNCNPAAELQ